MLYAISVISVTRPLDYEQVSNGVIYLTVMAKDAGVPSLNSTVPITIEVFVSTSRACHCTLPLPTKSYPKQEILIMAY